jgi:phenylpropionate dioxygenase-like ring-hydroxylating dioxygenase large terminal subunit
LNVSVTRVIDRFPHHETFPTGWYAVALSRELRPGDVRSVRYFARDLVLFRTRSGVPSLIDAYCPHLGGHLGDGSVHGDSLRCPFHGFEWGVGGHCVKTGYGTKPPPQARVPSWLLREKNGLLLTWFDALGRPPDWEVPSLEEEGWTPFRIECVEVDSHPQETSENSVDLGHFTRVHHFGRVWATKEVETDGPRLKAGYGIERVFAIAGRSIGVEARFDVCVHGLGYSLVDWHVSALRSRMRSLILSTPVDHGKVHLRMAVAVSEPRSRILAALLRRASFWGLRTEVLADVPIWSRKRYVERPVLAEGDGPITTYRRWCEQFYPAYPATPVLVRRGVGEERR